MPPLATVFRATFQKLVSGPGIEDASMTETVARVVVTVVALYATAGVAFAIAFVSVGVVHLDHRARGAGWAFRLLILPGAVALWPVVALRWRATAEAPDPNRHAAPPKGGVA